MAWERLIMGDRADSVTVDVFKEGRIMSLRMNVKFIHLENMDKIGKVA
jgi:hypothetical protein